ncbi:MAG: hypothetical protein RLZZ241_1083 [Bacteroidota bacterium]
MKKLENYIEIQEASKVPKYQQIVNSVRKAVGSGVLQPGVQLPSVNTLITDFDISRDTVVKAYECLKDSGIIESVPGKGYYLKQVDLSLKAQVFLLFNKLSPHKKIIYDAFSKTLGDRATIDFFIYENNYRQFKELIQLSKSREYSHYVIICHFEEGGEDLCAFLNAAIPAEKLIVLDKKVPVSCRYTAAVYQDFEADIYQALNALMDPLRKYHTLKLVMQKPTYHPKEILQGFIRFCSEFAFEYGIVSGIAAEEPKPGVVYINLMEDDLVTLLKKIKETNLILGRDVGIISYNDTPLKEILLDGITVLSTDFENLGRQAAEMVLNKSQSTVVNPFYVIARNSL